MSHGGWHFYKVSTDCTSSACVSKACADAGMETPCAGASGCEYNNNEVGCTLTSEQGCGEPMDTTANILCGSGTAGCSLFEAVYTSMGTWSNGAACGLREGSFVSTVYIVHVTMHTCNFGQNIVFKSSQGIALMFHDDQKDLRLTYLTRVLPIEFDSVFSASALIRSPLSHAQPAI